MTTSNYENSEVKKKIERLFGRSIAGPDDVTDAIAIAITGTRFKP